MFLLVLTTGLRHYFFRFERFAGLPCGTARYLLLRLRLATTERRRMTPRLLIRFARLQRIMRIFSNKTSQISICETNTACVVLLAVNDLKRVFAAWIVLCERSSA